MPKTGVSLILNGRKHEKMGRIGKYEEFDEVFDEGFAYVELWDALGRAKDETQAQEIRETMRQLREASSYLKDVLPDHDVDDLGPFLVLLASRSQRRNGLVVLNGGVSIQPQPLMSYGFAEVALSTGG